MRVAHSLFYPFSDWIQFQPQRLLVLFCFTMLSGSVFPGRVEAHPISVSQENVYVTREKVVISMQIYVEDLYFFQKLEPDKENIVSQKKIKQAIEKHKLFLLDRLLVRDINGERLKGKVVSVDDSSVSAQGVAMSDLMAFTLVFQLEYPLSEPPEFLTFSQQLVDSNAGFPAMVQFNLKQEGSETPYAVAMKPREPQTIRFNWDHPPLAPDASEEDWQKWLKERREETLGITSYGTVYSFIYIEDFEVRHEILIPLATLESFFTLDRKDEDFLSVAEQEASREKIEQFFAKANPVEIDGIVVKPVISRLDFYGLDFKDFAKPAEKKKVSIANARVGIILSYSTKGTPDKVKVTWDMFNRSLWSAESVCFAFDKSYKPVFSKLERNSEFEWTNPGRKVSLEVNPVEVALQPRSIWSVPFLSIGGLFACFLLSLSLISKRQRRKTTYTILGLLLVASLLCWPVSRVTFASPLEPVPHVSRDKAEAVFKTLHKNIYRSFDYHTESDIYDALAKSADGSFLETLYRQINQSLKMQEQGGAVSRVTDVQWETIQPAAGEAVDSTQPHDERSFAVKSTWTVSGTVEHWGHIHTRTNQYQAIFYLEPVEGVWKLTGMNLLDQERLRFQTGLREVKLEEPEPAPEPKKKATPKTKSTNSSKS
ncbi:hypothetical protein Enr10x_38460 [Gimesia panareensis]|uniref:Uncharacterized protein n=1 Tax=Gimesia panareensis TaxID=2527978 RepID=A0A517QA48_9PLAN|nr:hypothetical protein [Gimesia panareensis]QDT28502.1 hypothetical protein Enr10x_38460 [Gimesia panareensis]